MSETLTLRPPLQELVIRLQRELESVAPGTIIKAAWDYKGGLKFDLELPGHLTRRQRYEVDRLIDHAEAASKFL